uniref:Uncharacterized protein n=1 Tax=Colletotrichum scovillei TaxID=1209932 RepID=A0A9P7QTV7_9PEZI
MKYVNVNDSWLPQKEFPKDGSASIWSMKYEV